MVCGITNGVLIHTGLVQYCDDDHQAWLVRAMGSHQITPRAPVRAYGSVSLLLSKTHSVLSVPLYVSGPRYLVRTVPQSRQIVGPIGPCQVMLNVNAKSNESSKAVSVIIAVEFWLNIGWLPP